MHSLYRLLVGLATLFGATNYAIAAPTATALPRIASYSFSGDGCQSDNVIVTAETGKLIVQMNDFWVQSGDADNFSKRCVGHFNMNEGVPGYRLAIKSVSYEGYLFSSGGIRIGTSTDVQWASAYDGPKPMDAPSNMTVDGDGAKLQLYRHTVPVPLEHSSACVKPGVNLGILNIYWLVRLDISGERSYGSFMGMEGSPVTGTVEFEWVSCEEPAVEIETR